jgi:hypothetical protein
VGLSYLPTLQPCAATRLPYPKLQILVSSSFLLCGQLPPSTGILNAVLSLWFDSIMAYALFCLVVTLVFAAQSLQDTKDPVNDFCRRFGHQTAVIDRKLYIDGGLIQWNPISQNPLNYTSMRREFLCKTDC